MDYRGFLTVALTLLALAASPASAQEKAGPVFRIDYEVNVPDEAAKERIGMYLRNELRSLGDVEVTLCTADTTTAAGAFSGGVHLSQLGVEGA